MMEMEREVVGAAVQRTMSDNVNDPPPTPKPTVASQDVLVRKEEVDVVQKTPGKKEKKTNKNVSNRHIFYIFSFLFN